MSEPMLDVDDLRVVFSTPAGPLTAVAGVSLQLAERESIAIVGESGSGKSVFARTLMNLLAGNGTRTGTVRIGGRDIDQLSKVERKHFFGVQAAMVFQDPMTSLNPVKRIGPQLTESMRYHLNVSRAERLRAVRAEVDPEFAQRFAAEPEKARTTIAGILAHPALADLLKEHLLNPHLLDFAELVMGPFVQLDSFEITGFPSRPAEQVNHVADWHRDAFNYSDMWANHPSSAHFKPHPYTAPTACNCLTYLQDMTGESGPLRVVPGSHLDFSHIPAQERDKPHPREVQIGRAHV